MKILTILEDNGYDGSSTFAVCVSKDKEKLENLIPLLKEEIESFFLDMKKLYAKLDSKYYPRELCRRSEEEINELENNYSEIKSKYFNLSRFNAFDFISQFCESREFIIEEKLEI